MYPARAILDGSCWTPTGTVARSSGGWSWRATSARRWKHAWPNSRASSATARRVSKRRRSSPAAERHCAKCGCLKVATRCTCARVCWSGPMVPTAACGARWASAMRDTTTGRCSSSAGCAPTVNPRARRSSALGRAARPHCCRVAIATTGWCWACPPTRPHRCPRLTTPGSSRVRRPRSVGVRDGSWNAAPAASTRPSRSKPRRWPPNAPCWWATPRRRSTRWGRRASTSACAMR